MTTAITGATGFLGLRLLAELLDREDRVIVLSRPGPVPVLERVAAFLRARGAPPGDLHALPLRVRVVHADITRRDLGLDPDDRATLTRETTALWHNAANTGLSPVSAEVRRTNLVGTRNVLALADRCPGLTALRHSSTFAVAGRRAHGVIGDDDLDDSHGFCSEYERSKYDAEVRVRRWAAAHPDHDVLVFRLALLTSDLPPYPGAPAQPLVVARDTAAWLRDRHPEARAGITVPCDGDSPVNVLPVEHAARAMADAAAKAVGTPMRTINVVSSDHVPARLLVAAVAESVGVPCAMDPAATGVRVPGAAGDVMAAILPFGRMTRTFADTALAGLGLACPREPVIDRDYLRACLR
ncbi:SDR family oxidoreductase [Streptomonospora sp. S1-112]|uniref:SDR family oxidoreductase n=1 Tax=Streptomonospora mangrovi TaxID=2883123 RepID=A0A9X3NL80_9ACTN|nr:SDR family oxidoreductase [Streptomonospora mangrovi]MDA0565343.1 SDR family oxidoreductase [Streptomonospora mangrovi]